MRLSEFPVVCSRTSTHDFILVFCYSVDNAHLLLLKRVKCTTGVHMQDGKHVEKLKYNIFKWQHYDIKVSGDLCTIVNYGHGPAQGKKSVFITKKMLSSLFQVQYNLPIPSSHEIKKWRNVSNYAPIDKHVMNTSNSHIM